MQTTTHVTIVAPTYQLPDAAWSAPFPLRILNWLAERDRRYREAHKLANVDDDRLNDMGIAKKVNATFDLQPMAPHGW